MPTLDALVLHALQLGASDLHLEPGLPATLRIQGQLRPGEQSLSAAELEGMVRGLLRDEAWDRLLQRRSADLSLNIAGVRCRINVMFSQRGLGIALRVLHPFTATLESRNLHPDVGRLITRPHGLVVVSGPTGSGKSSTIAALVEELNRSRSLHVITIEEPIEITFRPRRCLIRQREVGRDTPSFQQGLMDALREDPDVLVVGEVREAETIRLALTAAETGHLVITTLHAGSSAEALARIVQSFAPEVQPAVTASLAESLVGVLSQRLVPRADLGTRLPECELLLANDAVRGTIRTGTLNRLHTVLQTHAAEGMWSVERWRRWQESRERYFLRQRDAAREPLPEDAAPPAGLPPAQSPAPAAPRPAPAARAPAPRAAAPAPAPRPARPAARNDDGVWDLDGSGEDLASILKELG
jgi:twitching motility protein PilT